MSERRLFSRVPLTADVVITDPTGPVTFGRTVDVSLTGVRLELESVPRLETRCHVQLIFGGVAGTPIIQAEACVVRTADDAVVLQLMELDMDAYKQLRLALAVYAPDPDILLAEFERAWGMKKSGAGTAAQP
ncbi:MAG: hypothetical protein ACI9WU_000303 [Myxococcota bacterium]